MIQLLKMIIFQQLRPFVNFCQFFGLFPFFIENVPETKQFKKFAFSWKHPVTWWFIILFFTYIIYIVLDLWAAWEVFYYEGIIQSRIPSLFGIFFFLEHIHFFIIIVLTRLITLNSGRLRRVICLLKKVNNELNIESLSLSEIPKVKRRVNIGIVFILICVSELFHCF